MSRCIVVILLLLLSLGMLHAADGPIIDNMDELRFRIPKEKGKAQLVEGKNGKAVQFSFDKGSQNTFFIKSLRGSPEWDKAAGISFWVKGDGSEQFAGLQFIYDEDYAVRYDVCIPIRGMEWTKVSLAWSDFVPVLPGAKSIPLDPVKGNKPSKLSALWFGKWWYWRDYPALSFAVDDIRLEPVIERDTKDYKPEGAPLKRVLAKLKAGKPITIVTVGDSLTDYRHWANRKDAWPVLLQKQLEAKYKSKVTIVNPAIGGTQLRQNLVLLPRSLAGNPEPDLVTICFGFNDWDAGMRGKQFEESYLDAIDRIRRATHGQADVLVLTTLPAVVRWEEMAELSEACRKAARERNAGLADTEKAFHAAGKENKERLYGFDKTHLGPPGHELMAKTVQEAIEVMER